MSNLNALEGVPQRLFPNIKLKSVSSRLARPEMETAASYDSTGGEGSDLSEMLNSSKLSEAETAAKLAAHYASILNGGFYQSSYSLYVDSVSDRETAQKSLTSFSLGDFSRLPLSVEDIIRIIEAYKGRLAAVGVSVPDCYIDYQEQLLSLILKEENVDDE